MSFELSFEFKSANTDPPPTEHLYDGWRPMFFSEGGNENPLDQPAVTPAQKYLAAGWIKYGVKIEFTKELQLFVWEFFQYTNPAVTKNNYRGIFDANRAFTNFNSWHDDPDPAKRVLRADWVNQRNTDMENPYLMDGIVCDGTFRTFREDGIYLVGRPGIDAIDANHLPTVRDAVMNGWYFRATIYGNPPYDWSQGHGNALLIPYFLAEETYYNKSYFQQWQFDRLPNPLKIGG